MVVLVNKNFINNILDMFLKKPFQIHSISTYLVQLLKDLCSKNLKYNGYYITQIYDFIYIITCEEGNVTNILKVDIFDEKHLIDEINNIDVINTIQIVNEVDKIILNKLKNYGIDTSTLTIKLYDGGSS